MTLTIGAEPMKSLTKELWMEVPERRAIVSIHREIEQCVAESGVMEGILLCYAMHIALHTVLGQSA